MGLERSPRVIVGVGGLLPCPPPPLPPLFASLVLISFLYSILVVLFFFDPFFFFTFFFLGGGRSLFRFLWVFSSTFSYFLCVFFFGIMILSPFFKPRKSRDFLSLFSPNSNQWLVLLPESDITFLSIFPALFTPPS